MARKKLADDQLKKLEAFVLEGKTPEDISKFFNIAVSSVHNYKKMLKERGLKIPDIRGKRPKGISGGSVETITSPRHSENPPSGLMKVNINNVVFYISPNAKSVFISDNEVTVTF